MRDDRDSAENSNVAKIKIKNKGGVIKSLEGHPELFLLNRVRRRIVRALPFTLPMVQ